FAGGAATKGKASAQGKNDAAKGLNSLPPGLVAALTGNTSPTIQLVTSDGLCVGATMSKVGKDDGKQYKGPEEVAPPPGLPGVLKNRAAPTACGTAGAARSVAWSLRFRRAWELGAARNHRGRWSLPPP
ncbi:MAG: hypothetical protein ABIR79_24280, partial [Candidatus Binatia bacterium]